MSSKFFARADDESETEESSEEESYDSGEESSDGDEDDDDENIGRPGNRFLVDSDSEDDDTRGRVIKSGKDKRFEAMVETSKSLRNHMKINDWISIQNDFDTLNKQLEKHMTADLVSRKMPSVPDIFIGSLVLIEDFLTKTMENKPKLSKTNSKALSAVKQRVRKQFKQYGEQMQKFKDAGKSLDDEDIVNPRLDDEEKKPIKGTRADKFKGGRGSDDDDDSGFEMDDDAKDRADGDKEKKLTPEEMSEDQVYTRLREILATRGRKGTDKQEHVAQIEALLVGAKSAAQNAEIILSLISAQFDVLAPGNMYMLPKTWRMAVANVKRLIEIATENYPNLVFEEGSEAEVLVLEKTNPKIIAEELDEGEEEEAKPEPPKAEEQEDAGGPKKLRGNVATLIERLDDELYKAWQNTDAYGQEYVELLKDERPLMELMHAGQVFLEEVVEDLPGAARIAARRILHVYYKSEDLNRQVKELNEKNGTSLSFEEPSLQELAVLVYRYGEEKAKSQTMLCHIYNLALADQFYQARDMLLLSHLQESVSVLEVSLQVLFNRTMAQIGLCAFRLGMPYEAHSALQELSTPAYSGSGSGGAVRLRELLAQGMIQLRGFEKTAEQEKAERKRQVPYHMHLPLDLIDTAHLVSAMLLELPNMALSRLRGDTGVKRRVISKTFQYYLRTSLKQAFSGPAENTRDHVMSASRCLMSGEWKRAYDIVASIRAWQSMEEPVAKSTLLKVRELIKVEGLRTFVLSYSSFYNSLSTVRLSQIFELDESKVHSVISKMIINEELKASWDQPTASVVIRRIEPTRLQSLALQLSQKCLATVEHNEKLVDARAGGMGGRGDDERDGRDWKGGGGRGGRGRGDRGPRVMVGGGGGGYRRDYNNRDNYRGGRDNRYERNYQN